MKSCRTCIVCRKKRNKKEFFRIVSNDENKAYYDKNHKYNSRGIYLCKSRECLEKSIKLIDKNKLNIKISVDKISLKSVIKDVENELGE